jgi:alpha-tubulin suppressor-like RCC1 family protein
MGFESLQPRKQTLDDILAGLKNVPEPNNLERTIDGVACKIFPTSGNTWNVYQDGVVYAVTQNSSGELVAAMESMVNLPQHAASAGKLRAVAAVKAIL